MSLYQRRMQLETGVPTGDEEQIVPQAPGGSLYSRRMGIKPQAQTATPTEDDGFSFGTMVSNIPSSAYGVAEGTYQAVRHPIETAQGLYELGWDGLVNFYKDRYGSVDNFLKTLEEDPVGVALDASTLATGGGAAAARAPGVAGKIGKAAQAAGRATDPMVGIAKGVGKVAKGAKRGGLALAGGTSATHQAPRVAYEMGVQGAGQSIRQKLTGQAPDVEPETFKSHMRDKADPDEASRVLDKAEKNIRDKAQAEIDADLAPLYADPRGFDPKPIYDTILRANKITETGSKASQEVLKTMKKEVDDWFRVPSSFNSGGWSMTDLASGGKIGATPRTGTVPPLSSPTAGPVRRMASDEQIAGLGLDPATATNRDFLAAWSKSRHSTEGLDRLKRRLDNVYPHYEVTTLNRAPDGQARKVAAVVVNSVKKQLRDRHGAAYDASQQKYGKRMGLIKRVRKTFGFDEDQVSRRVGAINRDTVFADFGNRAKLIQEFAREGNVPEHLLMSISSGRQTRGWQPRNLMSGGTGAVASAVFLNTPTAVLWAAMHFPRLVGEGAHAAGRAEGMIRKPLEAAAKALKKVGITPHGISVTAGQAGTKAEAGTNRERLKSAITEEAKKKGYNLHGRVVTNIANQLTSENPELYIKGLRSLSQNKRLMELFEELGK